MDSQTTNCSFPCSKWMNPKQIVLGQQLTMQRSRKMRRNCAAYSGVTTTASSTSVQLTTTLCALPGWEFVAKHCSSSPHLSTNKLQSISLPHLFEFCFFSFSRLKMIQLSSCTSSTNGASHPHESTQHCCTSRKTRSWERAKQGTLFLTERKGTPPRARC